MVKMLLDRVERVLKIEGLLLLLLALESGGPIGTQGEQQSQKQSQDQEDGMSQERADEHPGARIGDGSRRRVRHEKADEETTHNKRAPDPTDEQPDPGSQREKQAFHGKA